jgi:hypothetical protein
MPPCLEYKLNSLVDLLQWEMLRVWKLQVTSYKLQMLVQPATCNLQPVTCIPA